jgi:hypothetical protein
VSLKGSLEDFGLPEVLQLLADTSKTGKLQISGHGCANGSLWFETGSIVAFDVSGSHQPSQAIFEMLRVGRGYFDFQADGLAPASATVAAPDRQDVRTEIERARAQLKEWDEILTVVPSLDHHLQLVNALATDTVTIERDQWAIVAAIGGGQKVSRILSDRYLGEFEGCKAIKGLVDAGLVGVTDSAGVAVTRDSGAAVPVSAPVTATEVEPVLSVEVTPAEPEPAAEASPEPFTAAPEEVSLRLVPQPDPAPPASPAVSPLAAFGLTSPSQPIVSAAPYDDDYVYKPAADSEQVAEVAAPAAEAVTPAVEIDGDYVYSPPVDDAAPVVPAEPSYSAPAEVIWSQVDNEYTQSADAGWSQADDGYAEPVQADSGAVSWGAYGDDSLSGDTDAATVTEGAYAEPVSPAYASADSGWAEPAATAYDEPASEAADQDQFAELRAAIAKAEAEKLAAAGAQDGEAPVAGPSAQAPEYEATAYQAPEYQTTAYQAPEYQTTAYQAPEYQAPAPVPEDDGRSALRALLAEVTSHVEAEPVEVEPSVSHAPEPVDALVDRGPWTSHELASLEQMDGWREDDGSAPTGVAAQYQPVAAESDNVVPFPGISPWSGEPDEAPEVPVAQAPAEPEGPAQSGEEPINRGLLLKFLSSVRN